MGIYKYQKAAISWQESMVLVIVFCLIKDFVMGMGLWEFIDIKRQLSHEPKASTWSLVTVQ